MGFSVQRNIRIVMMKRIIKTQHHFVEQFFLSSIYYLLRKCAANEFNWRIASCVDRKCFSCDAVSERPQQLFMATKMNRNFVFCKQSQKSFPTWCPRSGRRGSYLVDAFVRWNGYCGKIEFLLIRKRCMIFWQPIICIGPSLRIG